MDIKCKIKLLETIKTEESKAFCKAYKKNKGDIWRLKKENKSLQRQVSKLKPFSVDKVLDERLTCLPTRVPINKAAMRMNFRVLPTVKKVNDQKYLIQVKEHQVQKVKQEYEKLQNQTDVHEREQKMSRKKIKKMGFSLEVVTVKCVDAKKSVCQYQRVKNKVEKMNLSLKCEVNNLEHLSCTKDFDEVEKVEQLLRKTLKERPELIIKYKDKLPIFDDTVESNADAEEEELPPELEGIYRGVQNIVEGRCVEWMLKPFIALNKVRQKLQQQELDNDYVLKERRKEMQKIENHLAGMKAKPDKDIQSWLDKVSEAQQKHATTKETRNQHLRILSEVKVALMLLLSKLEHVKLGKDPPPKVSPDSEDFVLAQLTLLECKLERLQIEFQRQNLTAIEDEMEKAQNKTIK